MEEYLRCLSHENRFLRCFAPETVHALLLGLDENYPLLILNLYGPVLAAALGCVLTRQSVARLRYDPERLTALLTGRSRQETEVLLRQAAEVFIRGAGLPGGSVRLPPPQRAGAGGRCDPRRIAGPSGGGAPASRRAVTPCIFRPKWVQ